MIDTPCVRVRSIRFFSTFCGVGKVRLLGHPDDLMDRVGTQCKMGPIHTLTHTHTHAVWIQLSYLSKATPCMARINQLLFFQMP